MEADDGSSLNAGNALEREEKLSQLVSGYRVSQAIYVVVKLGIPDLLADGPMGSDEQYGAIGHHHHARLRLLRH